MKFILAFLLIINALYGSVKEVTLSEAINTALENNKQSKISKIALEIAKVQHKQALSANYPAISAMIVGQRVKEDVITNKEEI